MAAGLDKEKFAKSWELKVEASFSKPFYRYCLFLSLMSVFFYCNGVRLLLWCFERV
jgi:succinate dehydrogenase/fumarate reductase cytochrome b subunit